MNFKYLQRCQGPSYCGGRIELNLLNASQCHWLTKEIPGLHALGCSYTLRVTQTSQRVASSQVHKASHQVCALIMLIPADSCAISQGVKRKLCRVVSGPRLEVFNNYAAVEGPLDNVCNALLKVRWKTFGLLLDVSR
jgi:hypothetical protein